MTIAPSPQMQTMANTSVERVYGPSEPQTPAGDDWKDASRQEQLGKSPLLDAIYRDQVTGDYQRPSRLKVWGIFGVTLGLTAALGAAWPQQAEAKPPLRAVTLDLTEGPGAETPSLPPPPPPPPPGGRPSLAGQTPIKPEEIQVPAQSQDATLPTHLPESNASSTPGPSGGVPGGEVGVVLGGSVGGKQGGVLGAPPHGGGLGSDTTVTPPRADAAYLRNPQPFYPPFSRRAGETGTVRLRVLVGANGKVIELEVKQSSGFPRLDQAALEAVRKWTFLPARRGTEALEAWVLVPITFSLNN